MFGSNTWNHLTMCKQMSSNFLKIKLPTNCHLQILYTYIHTHTHIYIYIYIYIYMYVCMSIVKLPTNCHLKFYIHTHTHTHIYIYIYICVYVCMYVCLDRFGWILWIVSSLNFSIEDVKVFSLVFLLLGQVGKERTLY